MTGLHILRIQLAFVLGASSMLLIGGCGNKNERAAQPPPFRTAEALSDLTNIATSGVEAAPAAIQEDRNRSSSGWVSEEPSLPQQNISEAFEKAESLRERGDFDAAISLLSNLSGLSGEDAAKVSARIVELKNDKRSFLALSFAVEQLASENPETAEVASDKLTSAGDIAKIVLRKAVREAKDDIAVEAARLLADMEDYVSTPDIVARFLETRGSFERAKLAGTLCRLAHVSNVRDFVPVLTQKLFTNNHENAMVLVAVLKLGCNGDSNTFEQVFGNGSYTALRSYASDALSRTNEPAVARWAFENASLLNLFVPGIKGQYYAGTSFEKLLLERIDDKIWVEDRSFPYPDGRQDDISVRWTGKIIIPKSGRYTFKASSDDGNRMWVDGKLLFDHWGSPANHEATIELNPGLHDIRIEFQQGAGGAWIRTSWLGPDFPEQPLDSSVLRTIPLLPQ